MASSSEQILPEEAVALYRAPLEAFIAARDDLAGHLRAEGRTADATAVKALKKPTMVAWALDQLAVRDQEGLQALLSAGAEVRAAQQAALSSKRGATDRLRAAGAARRDVVAHLSSVAVQALADAGKGSATHADQIVRALETCSVDAAAGSALASGTLDRPPEASAGFGDVFALTSVEGHIGPDDDQPETDARPAGRATTEPGSRRAERAMLTAEIARLRRDRDGARRRARTARDAANGFAHELEGMRRRLEVVERKHAEAAATAAERELELARAERALKRATAPLGRADPESD
ncbi:MAG: hypothetical protein OEV60_04140 [Actinomycetota bacterium]|nr:hypothetical protein [Actinomycetota bacterium]MDH5224530.1 hypothetical protein [Actinomycetota bacterium]MDH5313318.1 hypothetical protein [Actinomycetota bacterium]